MQEFDVGGRNYQDLLAWQKAMDLAETVYRISKCFPKEETYGLTSQVRRAAVSIPSNIAEGQGRKTNRDFANFIAIAYGSLREVETQIILASRLGYIDDQARSDVMRLAGQVGRLTNGLAASLDRGK